MEKTQAESILRAIESLSEDLNKLDSFLRQLGDDDERRALLQALGSVMGILVTDMIRPIVRQYPELDSDEA